MKHSNSLYSLEDEFFQKPDKREQPGIWKWVVALVLVLLFVYRSTRPVARLSAEPPPSFYEYNRSWTPEERHLERQVANEYWRVAVRRIQRSYSPYSPLPEKPPPQFRISDAASNLKSDVAAARGDYWYRLRGVWNQRDAWVVSYGWNTDWVGNTVNALPQYMPQWLRGAIQTLVDLFSSITQKISPP